MPKGDRLNTKAAAQPVQRPVMPSAERQGRIPILHRIPALCLALAFCIAAAPLAFAKDVPTPRISPLKLEAEDGDALAEGESFAVGSPDEPVDTSIIPPSGPNGESADFFAVDGLGEIAGDQPLQLMPLDPSAAPADGPIDLNAVARRADPLGSVAPSDDDRVLGTLTIEARLTEDGAPIQSGMVWRVFRKKPNRQGKLPLVGEANGGPVTLKLRPGEYAVHASYGRAGFIKNVTVSEAPSAETIVLNAGGLRLAALVGKDRPLPTNDVRFDIYASDETGVAERILLAENVPPTRTISLNAGIYHVVCRYGDANAVVRADIRVEPGKLTEAAVYQKAARLTLKLVEEHGGEALANTSWSVVTPAGESVVESVGAFPSVVLSAGEYTAIAKHDDKIFERNFAVEPGLNRDVEVLAQAN